MEGAAFFVPSFDYRLLIFKERVPAAPYMHPIGASVIVGCFRKGSEKQMFSNENM